MTLTLLVSFDKRCLGFGSFISFAFSQISRFVFTLFPPEGPRRCSAGRIEPVRVSPLTAVRRKYTGCGIGSFGIGF